MDHEMSKSTLHGINSDSVDEVWTDIIPYVLKTLEYCDNKYDLSIIYKCLKNKEMQLWIASYNGNILSYAITQIIDYPKHKRMCVLFSGGIEMVKWLHFMNELKEWGKYHGCEAVEVYGRPGWEKALAPYGFEKIHTAFKANI